jgi:hypothetical protein
MSTDLAEKPIVAEAPGPGSGTIRLSPKALKLQEFGRRAYFVKAPPAATQEDPLHPAFWAPVAKDLTRHDIIRLLADDESWEMELIVERVRQSGADVTVWKVGKRTPLSRAGAPIGDDHRTEYRANEGWCVVRVKDGHPIVQGHTIEASAVAQFHREQPKVA